MLIEKGPKIGDVRRIAKFAILPTKMSSGDVIWLEWYYRFEIYELYDRSDGHIGWIIHKNMRRCDIGK